MVLEKTLESPLDYKEIKSVKIKEIKPEYSWEGLTLKLKLQYFGHLMGKTEGKRRRGQQSKDGWMVSLTQWT